MLTKLRGPVVLPQMPMPVDNALQSVLTQLEIVKNDAGQFFIPNVINMLGNMEVGEGYKMYLANPATLIYPASTTLPKNIDSHQLNG